MSDNFISRDKEPLPNEECTIKVMVFTGGEEDGKVYKCKWKPFNPDNYPSHKLPTEGYLGTAVVIEGDSEGVGFHCWEQNNDEFLYYCLV